tara:strand:+ start:1825 stop:2457 length:633 start_codon:yes stop_codon:yes gene_type:complete
MVLNPTLTKATDEQVVVESQYKREAIENASKANTYGGKRFLGFTPKGAEVWASMSVDRETLDLKVDFTHDLSILLQEGAELCEKRITVKRGSQRNVNVRDLIRQSMKNQGGKVTIQTLRHIQRLKNAVDMKFSKAYIKGKPTSTLFSYVAWAIFSGSFDMEKGDTSWTYIRDEFGFNKDGEYFTVESIPLFEGDVVEPEIIEEDNDIIIS